MHTIIPIGVRIFRNLVLICKEIPIDGDNNKDNDRIMIYIQCYHYLEYVNKGCTFLTYLNFPKLLSIDGVEDICLIF